MPYRLTVELCALMDLWVSSDLFRLIIRDRVYMFEVYAFEILHLLTELFNSLFDCFSLQI